MPNNMRNAYKIGGSSSAKKKKKRSNDMKRYDMGGTGGGGFTSSIDGMRDLTPQAMAMDTMAAAGGLEMFKDNGGSVLDPVQGMMKKGGAVKKKKKKQGYNSRVNGSLGMRNKGKEKQSMKSRRDESKGAKKAAGKRAYSGNRSSGGKK